jgi:hypothetical protein
MPGFLFGHLAALAPARHERVPGVRRKFRQTGFSVSLRSLIQINEDNAVDFYAARALTPENKVSGGNACAQSGGHGRFSSLASP